MESQHGARDVVNSTDIVFTACTWVLSHPQNLGSTFTNLAWERHCIVGCHMMKAGKAWKCQTQLYVTHTGVLSLLCNFPIADGCKADSFLPQSLYSFFPPFSSPLSFSLLFSPNLLTYHPHSIFIGTIGTSSQAVSSQVITSQAILAWFELFQQWFFIHNSSFLWQIDSTKHEFISWYNTAATIINFVRVTDHLSSVPCSGRASHLSLPRIATIISKYQWIP